MMASSAASSTVKSARKMKNVTATGVAAMCDPYTQAGSRFWIVHGWRPTSATIQPACEAR